MPPDSGLELFFRSLYHKINSTKVYTSYVIRKSEASYPKFLISQDEWLESQEVLTGECPEVTFFLPIGPDQSEAARITILSICAQRSDHWRLVIFAESENVINKNLFSQENQHHVVVIRSSIYNLGVFVENCRTEYFVCCVPGDQFSRFFLECFLKAFRVSPGSAIYYPDSDTKRKGTQRPVPHFKPGCYSPEMHLSTNYLSRSILSLVSARKSLGSINQDTDFLVQEWDLLLRICQENEPITHIPWVLVHQSREADCTNAEVEVMLECYLSQKWKD